jgi:two-component system chemotaxis response regulator CheY
MIDNQEIVREFVDESDEVLARVIDDLMELENNMDDETINRVFRAFHSIKGGARMLGFDRLGEFGHKAEDVLSLVRMRDIDLNANVLLHTVDTMRLILSDMRDGGEDSRNTDAEKHLLDDIVALAKQTKAKASKPVVKEAGAAVEKKAGGGFVLDLGEEPTATVAPVQALPLPPRSKPATSIVAKTAPVSLKILIVEDDFTSRTILDKFLSEFGNCDIASNGLEAISAFTETYNSDPPQTYDLICMDIKMPIMDGLQACKTIREIERGKGIEGTTLETAIVMTSAEQNPATIIRACYECGANYYFIKPLDFNQMKRQLQKLRLIT